jgi:hypothetical protein
MFLTPEYFMQIFGREKVDLTDCESGEFAAGTLEHILKLFDSPQGPHDPVWKVKVRSSLLYIMKSRDHFFYRQDWPSQASFREGKFSEVYEEFEDCLPFPHLTRLDGCDNLAAHFPNDAGLPPDLGNDTSTSSCLTAKYGDDGLGPKVYFGLAAKPDEGHHGSTRLHCDLTDAINVCVFAARQSDGSPGGARWDIFSPDDTTRLREVLRVHNDPEDPVLAQNTYLSPSVLRELEQSGIKASTFIQHEGDAVFIPAGCAHQVSRSLICATIDHDIRGIGQQCHQCH